ncbi:hypothetical protein FQN57_002645 [Myotisia sp. PD_48]|nr:hypothetical protein FQN57_002645 [Myotisia sp. PD_48]
MSLLTVILFASLLQTGFGVRDGRGSAEDTMECTGPKPSNGFYVVVELTTTTVMVTDTILPGLLVETITPPAPPCDCSGFTCGYGPWPSNNPDIPTTGGTEGTTPGTAKITVTVKSHAYITPTINNAPNFESTSSTPLPEMTGQADKPDTTSSPDEVAPNDRKVKPDSRSTNAQETSTQDRDAEIMPTLSPNAPGPGTKEPNTQPPNTQTPNTQNPDTKDPNTQSPNTPDPDTQEQPDHKGPSSQSSSSREGSPPRPSSSQLNPHPTPAHESVQVQSMDGAEKTISGSNTSTESASQRRVGPVTNLSVTSSTSINLKPTPPAITFNGIPVTIINEGADIVVNPGGPNTGPITIPLDGTPTTIVASGQTITISESYLINDGKTVLLSSQSTAPPHGGGRWTRVPVMKTGYPWYQLATTGNPSGMTTRVSYGWSSSVRNSTTPTEYGGPGSGSEPRGTGTGTGPTPTTPLSTDIAINNSISLKIPRVIRVLVLGTVGELFRGVFALY